MSISPLKSLFLLNTLYYNSVRNSSSSSANSSNAKQHNKNEPDKSEGSTEKANSNSSAGGLVMPKLTPTQAQELIVIFVLKKKAIL
jgi:hypothetical protein